MKTTDRAITIEEGEKIILEVRRHWFYLAGEITTLVVVMFLPVLLFDLISTSGVIEFTGNVLALYVFGAALWMLVLWTTIFIGWTNYFLDVWLITDRRLIDIEQESLFSRHVAECRLSSVEDVIAEMHGVLATALDFGDLRIQTASEETAFVITMIPHPAKVKDVLSNLVGKSVVREITRA